MRTLTWSEVWARRLARHSLADPAPRDGLVEVVRTVCGIHAQVMPAAELSVGIRVDGISRQQVRAELWEQRSLVKTYGLRGTVHLFPADELPQWTAALSERTRGRTGAHEARRIAQMGLDPVQVGTIVEAIGEALDGRCLTRDELGTAVEERLGAWVSEATSPAFGGRWPRWQTAIGVAANAGILCFGSNQGSKVTFVRPDQWLSGWTEIDGRQALLEIFRRYLSTYGPATSEDFARWFGLADADARGLTNELGDELEEVDVEGYRAWLLASDAGTLDSEQERTVQLLPHFDCYVVGCHPRDRLMPTAQAKRALARGSAGNVPVILIDGIVGGIWRHRRAGRRLEVQTEIFDDLSARQREELEFAVQRIGHFDEVEASFSLRAMETRPHL